MFQIKGLLFNVGYYDAVPEGMEGIVYFDVFLGLDVKLKNDSSMTLSMGAFKLTYSFSRRRNFLFSLKALSLQPVS